LVRKTETALPGPEPAEGAGGQQAVDKAIEGLLQHHAPWLALPDAVDQGSQTVSEERGGSSDAKHGRIVRAGDNGEIGDKETDKETVSEPHAEELRHGDWTAGKHGQKTDRSLLEFFLHGGRIHLLVGAMREMIETRRQASRTQGSKQLILFGELPVVALVILVLAP